MNKIENLEDSLKKKYQELADFRDDSSIVSIITNELQEVKSLKFDLWKEIK